VKSIVSVGQRSEAKRRLLAPILNHENGTGLIFRAQHNPDLFDVGTIYRVADNMELLLDAASAERWKAISELTRK